jgi:hypothetical protein
MSHRSACFTDDDFPGRCTIFVLELPSSSNGLPGFLNYWMADERNFAVHTLLMLSVYMCSAALSTAIVSQDVDVTVFMFTFILEGLSLACSGTHPPLLHVTYSILCIFEICSDFQ